MSMEKLIKKGGGGEGGGGGFRLLEHNQGVSVLLGNEERNVL